ncbi:uncharacterized protein LOC125239215 [Leguminivora glycinivorella]|uniref:uncharacterized protein LOC125239215 n=1 Tax=Leguminivora glycinivorella TaxID=1035111 RepID=UPI00200EF4BA|nr:uncharacterized protein LOC125239215 [Leguminivora glycinivorella]
MSEKSKLVSSTAPKTYKSRPSTVGPPPTMRRAPSTVIKDRNTRPTKFNKNATLVYDADLTIRPEVSMPDFESENKQVAYGKFLRLMLEDCLLEEKIEREETEVDKQMALLADRFQKTMSQLDKTNRRLKDISFVQEQERLIQMRHEDNAKIFEATANSTAPEILTSLSNTEQAHLDKLVTKNVDFGYDKNSGYKQLLDAVQDAIGGLEEIKKHSNLDMNKFKEYENAKTLSEQMELSKMDLEMLKTEFEVKFPKFSEKLLKEASEKFAKMVEDGEE